MHGKNNEPLVIVDADAIISFVYIDDENHHRAKQLMQQLVVTDVSLLFPTTAICEAITVLRGKLNRPEDAKRILAKFQSGDFPVQAVDHAILTEAGTLFNPNGSKKNTLFDAVVAAIAKRMNADAIFSFDEWYRKIGLTLTDDLIAARKKAA
ncbi:MAG TPA: PIN domain-containing protein [Methylomirabilota bacterium]|nr:PIN domain-containing protein [Methylomirabilota bacterium]